MNSDPKVWISSRLSGKKRRKRYSLRWIDTSTGGWQSEAVGTDYKRAQCRKVELERKMADGTFRPLQRTAWDAFTAEIAGSLSGEHARQASGVLTEFGAMMDVVAPDRVRHTTIRNYVQRLQERGLAVATINTKCRYLRAAFNVGVRSDYLKTNPIDGLRFIKEPKHELRILKVAEEIAVLAKADSMYGVQMVLLVRFVLATWARRSEAIKLQWSDVNFDEGSVLFRSTKSCEDRYVPIGDAGLLADLQKLQLKTLEDGGPFVAYGTSPTFQRKWHRIVTAAEIPHVKIHDLRRTGITRALLAGMPSVVVQKLAGHVDIKTTLKYYTEVSKADLRAAVKKLHQAGG